MATAAPPERTERSRAQEESGAAMSFFDHLVELRKRLISALSAVGVGMILGLLVSKRCINFVVQPMLVALRNNHLEDKLYYTSPAGYVGLYINLGLYLGVVIAMPWVLYQVWLFVAPGLYKHERRATASFIISAMLLFVCGMAVGYFGLLPIVLTKVIGFAAGGPIMSPSVEALLVTPAAAHSAYNRGVVLSIDDTLALDILPSSGRLAIEVDGMVARYVSPGDRIDLRARPDAARVIRLGSTTFYERARRKLRLTDSAEIEPA